ncbi:2-phosphosulfolactate phosphatase, partial [Candidatus Bathyarchaeota archaeon]|nr:2-phosphosulfolactate phosphatase [Candidatus Bathyarchaeota archaeon]
MEIRRLSLLEGARQATGTAVIIDVFRAFTTAAFVMANGAERVIPVAGIDEAFRLRELHPGWLIMGEQHGKPIPGFDYGNSPADVEHVDFTGRTVVQRTSSGIQGIILAGGADEVLLGSFVMAEATSSYIRGRKPDVVSLVAMGWEGRNESIEDELCADYSEARIRGKRPDFGEMRARIRADPQGAKFFDPRQSHFRERDFHLAMSLDKFVFTLKVVRGDLP